MGFTSSARIECLIMENTSMALERGDVQHDGLHAVGERCEPDDVNEAFPKSHC